MTFIDSHFKSNQSGFLYKLDIEKGLDHVSSDFLMSILEKWASLASEGGGCSFAFLLSTFLFCPIFFWGVKVSLHALTNP